MENFRTISEEIQEYKKKQHAIILAHNYQILEVQKEADYCGDSLQLARIAAELDNEVIVFCGVRFMAETAKLLNPGAKVLLPVQEAGCPMADMITAEQLKEFKSGFKDPWVICYVNSSIEVKAESDICCTSGNAVEIVNAAPAGKDILFVPDRNLGSYTALKTGRKITTWDGFCNVHENISLKQTEQVKNEYPGYKLVVHPECNPSVVEIADHVASTKGMADFVRSNDKVIIGTEIGLYYRLVEQYPDKKLVPLSQTAVCHNMKKTTLQQVLNAFKQQRYEITIPENIAVKALDAVNRMLYIKSGK